MSDDCDNVTGTETIPGKQADTLPTSYQMFIAISRYARWIPAKKRRETWSEVVGRFTMYLFEGHAKKLFPAAADCLDGIKQSVHAAILSLNVMPSMRALMCAGKALERDATCAYNCAYAAVDTPRVFDEILYILMSGTGVGFSVERQYICKLPDIPRRLYNSQTTIVVEDSKIGWAKAFRQLIALLYAGEIPQWDVSNIRPAGAPLRIMGGRASGPAPLVNLMKFTIALFQQAAGRKMTSFECHCLVCMVAEIVVVGGVRRSALISLSNVSDARMRTAKTGEWWTDRPYLSLANNSAVYTDLQPEMAQFFEEWKALYESKSGERGIFNRAAACEHVKKISAMRRGMMESPASANDETGHDGSVLDTDDNDTSVRLRDPNHVFGTNPCVTGDTMVETTEGRRTVAQLRNLPFTAVTANGRTHRAPFGFYFSGYKKVYCVRTIQGHQVTCTDDHKFYSTTVDKWLPIKQIFEETEVGHMVSLDKTQSARVQKMDYKGYAVVYDTMVENVHEFVGNGIRLHNCSEILLRPMGFCNLTEAVARSNDTVASIKQKLYIATVLGTLQSTLVHFRYLRRKWRQNCEDERLLGVSITGIMDCPLLNGSQGLAKLASLLDELREYVIEVNHELARELGIPPSAAITCVKPSGTVSQLVNASSGVHPRYSTYYIRTVRIDKKDPMYQFLCDQGVPVEDDVMRPGSTVVFSFPTKSPAGALTHDRINAIDQLEMWRVYSEHWAEHKVSATINVRESEWFRVGAWVYDNFDIMSGVSFLPHSNHTYQQAPYQKITEEEYTRKVREMPSSLNWAQLGRYETEDRTQMNRTWACTANTCEQVDLI